jgi:hypothetical protein
VNENRGGALPPRLSLALRSGFENRPGEPAASACGRWSKSLRPTSAAGSGTSGTAKRPRCCNALKRGSAVDFGLRCGSNGSRDERDFANFANGVWAKTWRRKPLGVPTARGASPTRPPWPSPCRMLPLPSSDFHPWSCGQLNPPNRRMRTRMSGGVAGEAGRPVPLCRLRQKAGSSSQRCVQSLQSENRWIMNENRSTVVRKTSTRPSKARATPRIKIPCRSMQASSASDAGRFTSSPHPPAFNSAGQAECIGSTALLRAPK